jgi:hypothetical protein
MAPGTRKGVWGGAWVRSNMPRRGCWRPVLLVVVALEWVVLAPGPRVVVGVGNEWLKSEAVQVSGGSKGGGSYRGAA